jgi:hypothetical protein
MERILNQQRKKTRWKKEKYWSVVATNLADRKPDADETQELQAFVPRREWIENKIKVSIGGKPCSQLHCSSHVSSFWSRCLL